MGKKLRNDATSSIDGIVYQFYVALKYAFDLLPNGKLFIEKYGDVTIGSDIQVEVKMYGENLTDSHSNLWNTLWNWLDPDFDVDEYETLILLTTQEIGVKSKLINWNSYNQKKKLAVLSDIKKRYSNRKKRDVSKEKLINNVLSSKQSDKLIKILEKFVIVSSNPSDTKYFEQLVMKYARNIPSENQKRYITGLLGFVISPKGGNDEKWTLTCEEFNNECQELTKAYIKDLVMFPFVDDSQEVKYDEYEEHLFVKKLEDIEYYSEREDAIREYAEIHSLVIREFLTRQVTKKRYTEYEKETKKEYCRLYRKANRDICDENYIVESQDFYDNVMTMHVQPFMTYTNTPKRFRNGILHMLADDENENVKWKLGEKNVESN